MIKVKMCQLGNHIPKLEDSPLKYAPPFEAIPMRYVLPFVKEDDSVIIAQLYGQERIFASVLAKQLLEHPAYISGLNKKQKEGLKAAANKDTSWAFFHERVYCDKNPLVAMVLSIIKLQPIDDLNNKFSSIMSKAVDNDELPFFLEGKIKSDLYQDLCGDYKK